MVNAKILIRGENLNKPLTVEKISYYSRFSDIEIDMQNVFGIFKDGFYEFKSACAFLENIEMINTSAYSIFEKAPAITLNFPLNDDIHKCFRNIIEFSRKNRVAKVTFKRSRETVSRECIDSIRDKCQGRLSEFIRNFSDLIFENGLRLDIKMSH